MSGDCDKKREEGEESTKISPQDGKVTTRGDQQQKRIFFFFKVGATRSMDPNMGPELTSLRSTPEPRSRVIHLTDWATRCSMVIFILINIASPVLELCLAHSKCSTDTI